MVYMLAQIHFCFWWRLTEYLTEAEGRAKIILVIIEKLPRQKNKSNLRLNIPADYPTHTGVPWLVNIWAIPNFVYKYFDNPKRKVTLIINSIIFYSLNAVYYVFSFFCLSVRLFQKPAHASRSGGHCCLLQIHVFHFFSLFFGPLMVGLFSKLGCPLFLKIRNIYTSMPRWSQ